MANPTQVTLTYTMPAAGSIPLATQVTRVQSLILYGVSLLKFLGVTVQSDNTTAVGSSIHRVVVFNLLPSFFARHPNPANWGGEFISIFKNIIGRLARLNVTASAPVFA